MRRASILGWISRRLLLVFEQLNDFCFAHTAHVLTTREGTDFREKRRSEAIARRQCFLRSQTANSRAETRQTVGFACVVIRTLRGESRRSASGCSLSNIVRKNHSRLGSPTVAPRKEEEEYEDFSTRAGRPPAWRKSSPQSSTRKAITTKHRNKLLCCENKLMPYPLEHIEQIAPAISPLPETRKQRLRKQRLLRSCAQPTALLKTDSRSRTGASACHVQQEVATSVAWPPRYSGNHHA